MSRLSQGEIWWATLPPPVGRRPVVILTRSAALRSVTNVTIAPLTRTVRDIPSEAVISPAEGVPELCAASLDNINTIPRGVLDRRITKLSAATMADVFRAIRFVFALPREQA